MSAADDADAVVDEAVTISHSATGGDYTGQSAELAVTIAETTLPALSITDRSASEDAGEIVFEVRLSVASSNEVTVKYATSSGTGDNAATAGRRLHGVETTL